jgi:hypothetical protein
MDISEEWRPIEGYGGLYEVSSLGRVRSWHTNANKGGPPPRILVQNTSERYRSVALSVDGRAKTRRVHTIVAEAFHGPRPAWAQTVRHLDGDINNNCASNLAYGTITENNRDMLRHGTHTNANKTHCKRGHEYDIENTRVYLKKNGGLQRFCRRCQAERHAEERRRKRAA